MHVHPLEAANTTRDLYLKLERSIVGIITVPEEALRELQQVQK